MTRDVLLDRICDLVPDTLHADGVRVDSCVLSSRVGSQVAAYFGIELKPLPIHVQAWNQQALDFVDKYGMKYALKHDGKFDKAGGWIVSIDETDHGRPGRYPGHLILRDVESGAVLDLSLGQISRPAKDIVLPKAAWFADFDPSGTNVFPFTGKYAGTVVYQPLADGVKDFRQGPDWKLRNPFAGQIIRKLKSEGAAA